jgi:hypothetical protein
VGVIPLDAGAEFLIGELAAGDGDAEVLVLGSALTEMQPEPATAPAVQVAVDLGLAFERELSVEQVPVLRSHVLDGKAVLPAALMAEWLAHGALHGNPGLTFHGFDGLRVLKGVRLDEDESRRVRVLAGRATRRDGMYLVPVELRSRGSDGREALHARAEIVLVNALPEAIPPLPELRAASRPRLTPADVYDAVLFHGPGLQAIETIETCTADGIAARVQAAPVPSAWLRQPLRTAWLTDPLALDAAFQLMIVWCHDQRGTPSLPCATQRYRQYRRTLPRDGTRVVAHLTRVNGMTAVADIDFLDATGACVARLEGYECVMDAALTAAFRRNRLAGAALVS